MSWNIEELTGYKPKTTFWDAFTIAEAFGLKEIRETYNRAFEEWKSNTEYITELVMVLNWKIFQHHERDDEKAKLYNELWSKTDAYCMDNLKGDDLTYFIRATD